MMKRLRLALALATLSAALSPAVAGDRYYSGNDSYPTMVLINPFTGAPYVAGGGSGSGGGVTAPLVSGTGGDQGATLGTTVVNGFLPAPVPGKTRKDIFVAPQLPPGSTATITLCKASSGITPAPYVAGCFTFGAGGSLKATPLGYVPQDSWNAVASVAGVPVTYTLIDQ